MRQEPGQVNTDTNTAPDRFDVEAVNKKENRELYKKRVKIHPKRVWGIFRQLKWIIMAVTLGIYYITPWLRWDRGLNAPDQAVLIDMPGRRFYFFFIEIWPQEVYYLAGLLIMAALGLFAVTSLFGRAWCGYACPQTVWTDLFIWVERFIEGDRGARIRLDKAPMSVSKASKRISKYIVWLLISVATGGAWIFYFADAPTLAVELFTGQAAPVAYITVAVLTFTTFSLGGLMREQVCIYMCPWPRIQAAMMDEESLTVSYKTDRGEPRMPYRKGESFEGRGDCIDCNACVVVCPQGIDIRDGQQMECITCGLCIDACDEVMTRINRPTGLIGYDSVANLVRRSEGRPAPVKLLRPRTIVYTTIWALIGAAMLIVLFNRTDLELNVLRDRNPVYTPLSDGGIRNGYTVKVLNKAPEDRRFMLSVKGREDVHIRLVGAEDTNEWRQTFLEVEPDAVRSFRVYVSFPKEALDGEATDITFVLMDINGGGRTTYDTVFRGPEQ
jgi:cytochrome c oxidase accessory protein FixG